MREWGVEKEGENQKGGGEVTAEGMGVGAAWSLSSLAHMELLFYYNHGVTRAGPPCPLGSNI